MIPSPWARSRPAAGHQSAEEEVAHRDAELVAEHHQHDARRDDLPERAGGGDHAGRELGRVAVAQHHRQRDEAHRDHRGAHHAGGGGEQRADEDHGEPEPAAQRPEERPMVVSRSSARRERSSRTPMKMKKGTASSTVLDMMPKKRSGIASAGASRSSRARRRGRRKERGAAEGEGHRIAGEDQRERRQRTSAARATRSPIHLGSSPGQPAPVPALRAPAPRRRAGSLISSETPCSSSSTKPTGSTDLSG